MSSVRCLTCLSKAIIFLVLCLTGLPGFTFGFESRLGIHEIPFGLVHFLAKDFERGLLLLFVTFQVSYSTSILL